MVTASNPASVSRRAAAAAEAARYVPEFGQLKINAKVEGGVQATLGVDRLAAHMGKLLLCSAAGPGSVCKAFRAILKTDGKVRFGWTPPGWHSDKPLEKAGEGYDVYAQKLGCGMFHVVAIARTPGFMTSITEESVWQALTASVTTPMLREWMPWLVERLANKRLLIRTNNHGCEAGLLLANDKPVDAIVTEGCASGKLVIPAKY